MDFDLPEELADYLPKQRQGFQLVNQHKPAKAAPKKVPTKIPTNPPKKTSTNPPHKKAPTNPPPKKESTNPQPKKESANPPLKKESTNPPLKKESANPPPKKESTNPPPKKATINGINTRTVSRGDKTIKTERIKNSNGTTTKVQTVYPNRKGKILSKVPENKWKEVRAGPREDTSIVRTKEEEIQIFLKYTNDYRIKNTLNPLEMSDELSQIADVHNTDMMEGKTKVGHEGFKDRVNQLSKRYYQASENCAMYVGPREHLVTLFENLCRSPVHNQNLLGNFDTIGIALGKNAENMWYVTQFFVRFNKEKESKAQDDE